MNFKSIFLVMDYGHTDFKKMLNSVPETVISEEHVVILLYNQLCALKFLHSANLVHRDIKPANLLLDDHCRVMICDFGLSRSMPEKDHIDREFRKLHAKSYDKIHAAPPKDRKSKQEEFKASVSDFLKKNKEILDKRPRAMTCQVMSRWYRAPEVILTCNNYG
jgi:serine/threonine protein kinase